MTTYKIIKEFLNKNEIARNDYKKGYNEFVKEYYCNDDYERMVYDRVSQRAITQAVYQREVAKIQNIEGLFIPCDEVRAKRDKHRIKKTEEYKQDKIGFFEAIGRYFNKLTK